MIARNYLGLILYTSRMRFGIVLVVLLAFGAGGCGPSDSRSALLRLKAKPGDKYEMVYTSKTHFQEEATKEHAATDEASSITVHKTFVCKGSEAAKSTWDIKTTDVSHTAGGHLGSQAGVLAEADEGKTETLERDERGVIVGQPKANPLECEFPIQKIQVGDAWHSEARVQGYKVDMIYRVESFEKIDGMDAVRISGKFEGGELFELVKPVESWFEVETGWPIKGAVEFVMKPRPGARLQIRLDMKRE